MDQSEHPQDDTVKRAEKQLALVIAAAQDALYVKAREGFVKMVPELEQRIRALDVKQETSAHAADDLSRKLKRAIELAEDMRKRELRPFEKAMQLVKDRWTEVLVGLTTVRGLAGAKREDAMSYVREQQENERKAREALLEEARKREQEAKSAVERQTALAELRTARVAVDELPPPDAPTKLRSSSGAVTTETEIWTWELLKLDDVPRDYLQLDRGAITKAVKGGARSIAGLRIFSKKGVAEK